MSVANRYSDQFYPATEDLQLNVYKGITRIYKRTSKTCVANSNSCCKLQQL